MISEARIFQHVDVRGECLSIFLIESCEISLQAHFSVVADILMYMFFTTTNGQQKSITSTNNRTVPLITGDFLLFVTKIHLYRLFK